MVALPILALALIGCGSQVPFPTPAFSGAPVSGTPEPGASGSAGTGGSPATSGPSPSGTTASAVAGSAGASVPAASLGPAAPVYTIATVDLRVTLPVGWVGFDSTTPPAAISDAIAQHPELGAALSLLQGGLAFVAVDAAAAGAGQPPSMTVSATGTAIPTTELLESLAEANAAQIAVTQPIDGDVNQATIELPSGPAVNLVWQLEPVAGAEPLGLDAYILAVGNRTFVVTFAAPLSVRDGFQPAFRSIIETMRPT